VIFLTKSMPPQARQETGLLDFFVSNGMSHLRFEVLDHVAVSNCRQPGVILRRARFLNIAEGSVEESRYYLILSQDLGYGQSESLTSTLEEISKLLNAYTRAILASDS
jgi:hypothetical protein